ncbi:SAP domain-containing ribonucleoprotein-like isoform 2 [Camelus ferus]|nr:SAP domain-containing ribonucleoprotein-like isoform 2 [Camelus ferus]
MAAETVELHKLKLAELKQECLARGLETKGIKQDLINRLQAYLEEHAEEEANEEDVLGDETEVNLDKLKERAQRFGLNVSSISRKSEDDEKLKKRKERFGIVTSSAGTGTTEDTEAKKRKRAERFGIA